MRSLVAYAIHKFFMERDFVYVHTPIITGQDCEGAGEMFQVTTLDLEEAAKKGEINYEEDFFQKPVSPDGQRTAGRRDLCSGISKYLYVWTDIPCRRI